MSGSIKQILVAVDPSAASQTAFLQALRLAHSMRAQLAAVTVTPRYEGNMNRWAIDDVNDQMSLPFQKCLKKALSTASSLGYTVRGMHRAGDPAEEIVAAAEEIGAGLLLMGCPQRTYAERLLLGRTIARVIGMSPCDVLLIPEGEEANFDRILVGIDGSQQSLEAGQRALDLAMEYGGTVHALSIIDIPADWALHYGVIDEARRKKSMALQDLQVKGQHFEVPVKTEIREGTVYQQIVGYCEEKDIQLIVLGSYGRTAITRFLMGSVVERVAALSCRPILVVKRLMSHGIREFVGSHEELTEK